MIGQRKMYSRKEISTCGGLQLIKLCKSRDPREQFDDEQDRAQTRTTPISQKGEHYKKGDPKDEREHA